MRARFFAPVQTGSEAHPASYKMGAGSFLGVKRMGCGVDHRLPSSAEFKERVELYLYSSLGLRGLFWGELWVCCFTVSHGTLLTQLPPLSHVCRRAVSLQSQLEYRCHACSVRLVCRMSPLKM